MPLLLDTWTRKRASTVLSVTLLAAACSAPTEPETDTDTEGKTRTARQGSTVGASEIAKKWNELGGVAVMGSATGSLTEIIPGRWEYQKFQNGVIFWSGENGAVRLSELLFTKWTGLALFTTRSGQNALQAMGAPTRDEKHLSNHDEAWFQNGVVVGRTMPFGDYKVMVVMEEFFRGWVKSRNTLGLPIEDEDDIAGTAGRMQKFVNGDLYLKPGAKEALAITSEMQDKFFWFDFVSPRTVGFPVADTQMILRGSEVLGFSQEFEGGDLYLKLGADRPWVVKGNVREGYRKHGGPAKWLGFPKTNTITQTNGDTYNNFEGGLVIDHVGNDVHRGVLAFKSLTFVLERIASSEKEFACGAADLSAHVNIRRFGSSIPTFDARLPQDEDDEYPSDMLLNYPIVVQEVADGTEFEAQVRLRDEDGGLCLGGESLGVAIQNYNLDNLYGLLLNHNYPTDGGEWGGTGKVVMTMRSDLPYDPSDFRKTQFWSWKNYKVPVLDDDTFAATFVDVGPDEGWVVHPFHQAFWQHAYQDVAANGVCFGMALEALDASKGVSAWGQPIYRYYESFAGTKLPEIPDATGGTRSLMNAINIKQGFQLGAVAARYALDLLDNDFMQDPRITWEQLTSSGRTDVIVAMVNHELKAKGHSVLPVSWGDGSPLECTSFVNDCKVVRTADGNHPVVGDNLDPTVLEIDYEGARWRYAKGPNAASGTNWAGTIDSGGRIFLLPYHLFAGQQLAPTSLTDIGKLIDYVLGGESGAVRQITDQHGRTVFEPGLAVLPTRWDQLRRDRAGRVPSFYPLPSFGAEGDSSSLRFVGSMQGSTLTFEIEKNPADSSGAPYPLLYQSAMFASLLEVPPTLGRADRITSHDIGNFGEAMTFEVPSGGETKTITWTIAGTRREKWKRFTDLIVRPGQKLTARVENGGKELIIDNDGPTTTGVLTVPVPGLTERTIGSMTIRPGPNRFEVGAPHLTIDVDSATFPWSRTPVTITLKALPIAGQTISAIEYSTDGGSTWTPYTAPFSYGVEGVSTLHYRARDNQFNVTIKTREIKIDTIRPETVVGIVPNGFSYQVKDFTPGSGAQSFKATITNRNGEITTVERTAPNGTIPLTTNYATVEYETRDVAGNVDRHTLTNRDYEGLIRGYNPVGYWRLNEAPGAPTAADLGSGQNPGSYQGTYSDSPRPGLHQVGAIASDPATSAYFSLSNSRTQTPVTQDNWVEIPHSSNQVPNNLTLEAWFTLPVDKPQQTYSAIVIKTTPGQPYMQNGYGIFWFLGELHFYVNSHWQRVSAPVTPSANWRHVVGVYDRTGGVMTIYLDGVRMGTRAASAPISVPETALRIGKGHYWSWYGGIDEVALYNQVLTEQEVRWHYERGRRSPL